MVVCFTICQNVKVIPLSVMYSGFVLDRVVRKPVNVNPGLNFNWSIMFSCLKMFSPLMFGVVSDYYSLKLTSCCELRIKTVLARKERFYASKMIFNFSTQYRLSFGNQSFWFFSNVEDCFTVELSSLIVKS